MARTIKRSDGLYQKNITLGRNPDGSYIRRTIYAKTQKELERKAAELVQQVSHGMCVAEDKTTFAALSEMWRQQFHPNMTERWRERQTGVLNNHLLPTLGHIKVRDLKPYYLQDIINQMAQKGFATSSMKKVKQAAAQIVEIAYEHDIVPRNVFAKVKVPSIEPNERRALTEEEKELLTRTWQGHRMGLGAMIMLYCGLRRGEMLALRWEDIDFHKKCITVNKSVTVHHNRTAIKEPKSKAGMRQVPIPNRLLEMLEAAPKENALICPSAEGKIMSDTAYRRGWYSYLHYLNLQAGGHAYTPGHPKVQVIDNITAHMLRHPYVKPTTKNQTCAMQEIPNHRSIVWDFCFLSIRYLLFLKAHYWNKEWYSLIA